MHSEGTVVIPLTQGKFATIDAEDAERVLAHKWHAARRGSKWYALSNAPRKGGGKPAMLLMHRLILNTPRGLCTDHIDGNGLNNRRANLRVATHWQNQANSGMQPNNTSGFIGVVWDGRRKKWFAQIRAGNRKRWLGYFECAEDAARARDEAARQLHGSFVVTNF
jgi:hypothetical protein